MVIDTHLFLCGPLDGRFITVLFGAAMLMADRPNERTVVYAPRVLGLPGGAVIVWADTEAAPDDVACALAGRFAESFGCVLEVVSRARSETRPIP